MDRFRTGEYGDRRPQGSLLLGKEMGRLLLLSV